MSRFYSFSLENKEVDYASDLKDKDTDNSLSDFMDKRINEISEE